MTTAHTERLNGHLVEPLAAKDVEIGWELLFGDEIAKVISWKTSPPRSEGRDRHLKMTLDASPWSVSGEETQTVYHVIERKA